MATKAGVGMSYHHSPSIAGHEAAEQALKQAGVSKPDFVFMFASVGYDQRSLLHAVREATGGAPLCGCSGEGTICGDEADEARPRLAVVAPVKQWRGGHTGEVVGDLPSFPSMPCRNASRNDQETSGMYNGGEGDQMTAQAKEESSRTS